MSNNGSILNTEVLVLNKAYEPLDICNVRRAIVMVFLEKAEPVVHMGEVLRSVREEYPIPSVIRVHRYISPVRDAVVLNKKNIFRRDNHTCQYCGAKNKELTIDHIKPKVKGGKDTWENLVTACHACNNKKGDQDLKTVGMTLQKKPRKPNRIHRLRKFAGEKAKEKWRPFLFFE
ncbi:MAG: HNH endonuclease [Candidatus Marinimicrobia bacterium]|nr:HNH endonuclease [Candidatus Neomarinimicrobiota bacterium]